MGNVKMVNYVSRAQYSSNGHLVAFDVLSSMGS